MAMTYPENVFPSVADWIQFPFKIQKFVGVSGTGTKTYSDPKSYLCYPEAAIEDVTNIDGENVITSNKLYIDGSVPVDYTDRIIWEGVNYKVQKILKFYDGNTGKCSIKVVLI